MSTLRGGHARRGRAFTLLELAIGIALSGVLLAAVMAVFAAVTLSTARQRAFSDMSRDAEFLGGLLTSDLRMAGLGVPTGTHIMEDCDATGSCTPRYGTTAPAEFLAKRIILAAPAAIGVLGDLPRPDSNYPAFGPLHNRVTGVGRNSIGWHTENNGGCLPTGCNIRTSSMFFPNDTSNACSSSDDNARTCPWGLRRLVALDRLQIIDGNGNWAHTGAISPLSAVDDAAHNNVLSLSVSPPFDLAAISGDANDQIWLNTTAADGPGGFLGQGWVTTLDRAFYQLVGTTVRRTQCWGDPDPEHANWPPSAVNTMPASVAVTPAVGGSVTTTANICTPAEIVARNVQSIAFAYFDSSGTAVTPIASGADKNRIVDVRWTITFVQSNNVGPTPLTYTAMGAARLQN
jgi:type II secretory pathway pseudopilin PulG